MTEAGGRRGGRGESGRREAGRREAGRRESGRRESGRRTGRGTGRGRDNSAPAVGIGPAFADHPRGRNRTQLSLEAIIDASVALLDEGGADALTFRRLAEELSVGVASMYWYVDSKDVLLDLALDHALAGIRTDSRAARSGDWTARVRYAGSEMYRVFVAHRWMAAQMILSSDTGPNTLRLWEYLGSVLIGAGFTVQQAFDGLSLLMNHAIASGIQEATFAGPGKLTAAERRRKLQERGTVLRSLDPAQFPAIVASADVFVNHDQAVQYADGLELIIAGLERQLADPER